MCLFNTCISLMSQLGHQGCLESVDACEIKGYLLPMMPVGEEDVCWPLIRARQPAVRLPLGTEVGLDWTGDCYRASHSWLCFSVWQIFVFIFVFVNTSPNIFIRICNCPFWSTQINLYSYLPFLSSNHYIHNCICPFLSTWIYSYSCSPFFFKPNLFVFKFALFCQPKYICICICQKKYLIKS